MSQRPASSAPISLLFDMTPISGRAQDQITPSLLCSLLLCVPNFNLSKKKLTRSELILFSEAIWVSWCVPFFFQEVTCSQPWALAPMFWNFMWGQKIKCSIPFHFMAQKNCHYERILELATKFESDNNWPPSAKETVKTGKIGYFASFRSLFWPKRESSVIRFVIRNDWSSPTSWLFWRCASCDEILSESGDSARWWGALGAEYRAVFTLCLDDRSRLKVKLDHFSVLLAA